MRKILLGTILSLLVSNVFSQIVINEIVASNKSYLDSKYQKYSDWVELYNAGSQSVNVGGYCLSDNRSNSKKWIIPSGTSIPSKGFLLIWCDDNNVGLHTSFNLSIDGEFLGLADNSGKYIDSLKFPQQKTDISFGRVTDASSKWGYFIKPTPNTSNNTSSASVKTETPRFSLPGGVYSGNQSITISSETGASIYYTTNGAHPTINSTLYSSPIVLTKTTVLKAIAVVAEQSVSDIESATFFVNERTFSLPILSISTDSNWLFQPDTGIYELGPNAETAEPHYGANYWLDKEIPMTFQLYSSVGKEYVNTETGAKIYGGYSRMHPVKSMQFKCKGKYGASNFDYKFFKAKDQKEYKNIAIRNSGNDFGNTMFRDAMMQLLTRKYMNLDYQESRHVSFFINGVYYGLTTLVEKINENFVSINHKIDPDSIDLLDGYRTILNGNDLEWKKFEYFYSNNDLSQATNYAKIQSMMDIDEFSDYMIAEIYYANTDWPVNNIKFWRKRVPNGKWRWIIYDTDFGFGIWGHSPCENTIQSATATNGPVWPNPPESTLLLRKLLANQTFKQNFVQRFAYHMNTTFKPERVHALIDSLRDDIQNEMPFQISKWSLPASLDEWNYNVEVMKQFGTDRPSCMQSHLKSYFSVSAMNSIKISHDTTMGMVTLADKVLEPNHTGSYFNGINVNISAIPKPGYTFMYWNKNETTSSSSTKTILPSKSSWKYLDDGSNQGTAWQLASFNDNSWKSGNGVLGYNESVINTTVSYGSDAINKYITTYFRKQISVSNPQNFTRLVFKLMRGDGAIVYVNGVQVIASNLPTSGVDYLTLAVGADDNSEVSYTDFEISPTYFVNGTNTIAVEVHQSWAESGDLSFDLQIIGETKSTAINSSSVDNNKDLQLLLKNNDVELSAVFKPTPMAESIEEGLDDVFVYPVPMNDVLHISAHDDNCIVTIFNIQGLKMLTTQNRDIDVRTFARGVYIVDIKTEKGNKRILVSKH